MLNNGSTNKWMLAGAAIRRRYCMARPTRDVTDPDHTLSSAAEGVTADTRGNVYGGDVVLKNLRKYVPK